jgi:hypothetical protein
MKMKKIIYLLSAVLLAFPLTACGTQMTELSDEDAEAIAMYSADVIQKYNGTQRKGYSFYIPSQDTAANSPENQNASADSGSAIDTHSENPSVESGSGVDPGTSTESGSSVEVTAGVDTTLTDLIGQEGVSFAITSGEVVDHYTVEGVMDLSPGSGKEYYLLHVTAVNSGTADAALDIPSKGFTFTCTIGDSTVSASGSGFVSNEFSSWQGTIPAGGQQELLLFFPFKKETLSDTSVFQLTAVKDETHYRITQ